ncbi:hypothetical protein AYK87_06515 [Stutzerimonas stutzeri]|nr:hypothetical protein AYK87_06515 [Stutzerimonas stutzeri]
MLFTLTGDLAQRVHLKPTDYRRALGTWWGSVVAAVGQNRTDSSIDIVARPRLCMCLIVPIQNRSANRMVCLSSQVITIKEIYTNGRWFY